VTRDVRVGEMIDEAVNRQSAAQQQFVHGLDAIRSSVVYGIGSLDDRSGHRQPTDPKERPLLARQVR